MSLSQTPLPRSLWPLLIFFELDFIFSSTQINHFICILKISEISMKIFITFSSIIHLLLFALIFWEIIPGYWLHLAIKKWKFENEFFLSSKQCFLANFFNHSSFHYIDFKIDLTNLCSILATCVCIIFIPNEIEFP